MYGGSEGWSSWQVQNFGHKIFCAFAQWTENMEPKISWVVETIPPAATTPMNKRSHNLPHHWSGRLCGMSCIQTLDGTRWLSNCCLLPGEYRKGAKSLSIKTISNSQTPYFHICLVISESVGAGTSVFFFLVFWGQCVCCYDFQTMYCVGPA